MECPNCKISFHPQMIGGYYMGENAKGANIYIFYQLCPSCKEPIVGLKELVPGKFFPSSNEEGMILLKKDKI
jgi:hypothetical protein